MNASRMDTPLGSVSGRGSVVTLTFFVLSVATALSTSSKESKNGNITSTYGIVVVENGNHTGAKPGKAILGPGFRQ